MDLDADPDTAAPADPAPQLYFGSVDEFVRDYLRFLYRRRIDGRQRVWAAKWWLYDEAVSRLESMWRAWEQLRLDPSTGLSSWFRDHADYHMGILMSPDGPFAAAAATDEVNHAGRGEPLPYEAPPAGLYPDERLL